MHIISIINAWKQLRGLFMPKQFTLDKMVNKFICFEKQQIMYCILNKDNCLCREICLYIVSFSVKQENNNKKTLKIKRRSQP